MFTSAVLEALTIALLSFSPPTLGDVAPIASPQQSHTIPGSKHGSTSSGKYLDYGIQKISDIPSIELTLGNNKQKVPVTLDTSDPMVWVPGENTRYIGQERSGIPKSKVLQTSETYLSSFQSTVKSQKYLGNPYANNLIRGYKLYFGEGG